MKKTNLLKFLVGASALAGTSATVMSCGTNTGSNKDTPATTAQIQGLKTILAPLKAIDSPTFSNVTVNKDGIASGTIAYSLKTAINVNKVNTSKLPFSVKITEDSKKKTWSTTDIMGLINGNTIGAWEALNDGNIHNTLNALLNVDKIDNAANAFQNNAHNNVKGLKEGSDYAKGSNLKIFNTNIKNNILTVTYPSFSQTEAVTTTDMNIAYNFTASKSYDLSKATSTYNAKNKVSVSNVVSTITEATKQYVATLTDKKLPKDTHVVASTSTLQSTPDKFNLKQSWDVMTSGKKVATITFDINSYKWNTTNIK